MWRLPRRARPWPRPAQIKGGWEDGELAAGSARSGTGGWGRSQWRWLALRMA